MRFSTASLSALALCLHAHAQSLNSTSLISALQAAGLTSLAAAAEKANATHAGQALLDALASGGNYTVFAPDNAAFNAPEAQALADDPEALAAVLSYHVLPGYFANSSHNASTLESGVSPAATVGRTLLANATYVNLEGGQAQVVAWTRNDSTGDIFFLNQSPQINVVNTTAFAHLLVATTSGILTPPRSISDTLKASNLTSLAGLLDLVTVPLANGTNATAVQALQANATRGYTLFAPDNEALRDAGTALASVADNQTALGTLLGNHYINGTSLYSPEFASSSNEFVSESGQTLAFTTNSSGVFVTSANGAGAKIVRTDVLVANGVVHVIDRVLVNLERDEGRAESAYHSATSAAGQSHTQTGPIGPTATATNGGAGDGGTHSGSIRTGGVAAGVLGALGWVVLCVLGGGVVVG